MDKLRLLSGIQPTGKLHIGNYLGALAHWVELQNQYDSYFAVVDLHSLTETYNPLEKNEQTTDQIIDLLALGIDPEKSVIFVQSHVPEHAELAWYFNTLVPLISLERMTQYKEKAGRQKANLNAGLLNYPILQAADILLYKPAVVPVGEDQLQHLELTNDIVKKFNARFGQTFSPVKPLLTKTPRIMSLTDPAKKMSKSDPKGCLFISDDSASIEKKLARAVTDSGKNDKLSGGSKNLFQLLEIFGDAEQNEFYREQHQAGTIRYADLKANLAKLIAHHFSGYREQRLILEKKPEYISQVITKGREKARAMASQTLLEVKKKMGLLLS